MKYPQALASLIEQLSQLPSVGPKTAERYAFYLLRQSENDLNKLSQSINDLKKGVKVCQTCLAISESNPCSICSSSERDKTAICIVENIQDLIAIEDTRQYNGTYFVLGRLISMIDKIGPESLNLNRLENVVDKNQVKELILALNFTVEGETTALYLHKIFKNKIKISRLATGLPSGSDLEYQDQSTIKNSLKYRNTLK
jgi:recombination protein RecR